MRILLFFLICINLAFADANITKAKTLILEFDKKNLEYILLNNKKINFFQNPKDKDKVLVIFSTPYKNYKSKNTIKAVYKNNVFKTININVNNGNYKSEKIQVQKDKVFPPKKVKNQISKDYKEAISVYSQYTNKALFNSKFQKPIDSLITSDFGKARLYNDKISNYHSGTDFRAKMQTPIKASNDGIVKIAKNRYFSGNSVIIDHGLGIYSQYYHLDKINVKKGEFVKKGQIIGLSGRSGRVTGPHLHFGIIINSKQVDPIDFIEKINLYY